MGSDLISAAIFASISPGTSHPKRGGSLRLAGDVDLERNAVLIQLASQLPQEQREVLAVELPELLAVVPFAEDVNSVTSPVLVNNRFVEAVFRSFARVRAMVGDADVDPIHARPHAATNDLVNPVAPDFRVDRVQRAAGQVFVFPFGDGDVAGVIHTTDPDETGIDIYMGIGGAPEGVLAAAALRCIGGQMQGRLVINSDEQRDRAKRMGVNDINHKFDTELSDII